MESKEILLSYARFWVDTATDYSKKSIDDDVHIDAY